MDGLLVSEKGMNQCQIASKLGIPFLTMIHVAVQVIDEVKESNVFHPY